MIDGLEEARRVTALSDLSDVAQGVARGLEDGAAAIHRVLRRLAGHRAVERGAEAVDIGPRPLLLALAVVLLERRIAGRDQRRQGAGLGAQGLAGGTEVDQDGRAVLADEDVRGLDVAVDEAALVDLLQPAEDRQRDVRMIVLFQRRGGRGCRSGCRPLRTP